MAGEFQVSDIDNYQLERTLDLELDCTARYNQCSMSSNVKINETGTRGFKGRGGDR